MVNFLTASLIASWVAAVAILSVQNAAPVSLKFLTFQSIQLPFGLVLAFSVGAGAVGTAIVQLLWGLATSNQDNGTMNDLADDNEDFSDGW